MLKLTLSLIIAPPSGWRRLRAAWDSGARLPSPLMHAAATAGLAVFASFVQSVLAPGATVGRVSVVLLSSTSACLGAAVCASCLAPAVLATRLTTAPGLLARHAAASALPVIASGALRAPYAPEGAPWPIAIGWLVSCASAHPGARILLDLSGLPRLITTAVAATFAGAPPLVIAWLCWS